MPATFTVTATAPTTDEQARASLLLTIFGESMDPAEAARLREAAGPEPEVRTLVVRQKRGERLDDTAARAEREGAAAFPGFDLDVRRS